MHRLVLFDIDATLLLTSGAGMRAMKKASLELFGDRFSWDVLDTSGGLDPQLFREAARQSAFAASRAEELAFRDRYEEHLDRELAPGKDVVEAMPGVHGILETLKAREDIVLGILTGNYPRAAALKLRAIDIDITWFPVRVFGDDGLNRSELGAVALRRYTEMHGRPIEPSRVLIVGDTPKDVECGLSNGFQVLAVGTGKYPLGELLASGAHRVTPDLSDPTPLLEMLGD